MQLLKVILVLLFFIGVALLGFLLIPVSRTFQANVAMDMSDVTVYRTLRDTSDWRNWYTSDSIYGIPVNLSPGIDSSVPNSLVRYVIGRETSVSRTGEVTIKQAFAGESTLLWKETVLIRKNILEKFRLLFAPSGYSKLFLGTVSKFKGKLDHPSNQISGIRLEVQDVPSFELAAKADTIPFNKAEQRIESLYEEVISHFKDGQLKYPGLIQTRIDLLRDSLVMIQVGAVLSDSTARVQPPLHKLDIPSHKVLIGHTVGNFGDVNDFVRIMNDWLKKHSGRFSADFWLEHQIYFEGSGRHMKNSFNIVQPIYFLK